MRVALRAGWLTVALFFIAPAAAGAHVKAPLDVPPVSVMASYASATRLLVLVESLEGDADLVVRVTTGQPGFGNESTRAVEVHATRVRPAEIRVDDASSRVPSRVVVLDAKTGRTLAEVTAPHDREPPPGIHAVATIDATEGTGFADAALAVAPDGTLAVAIRDALGTQRARVSFDGGRTLSEAVTLAVPEVETWRRPRIAFAENGTLLALEEVATAHPGAPAWRLAGLAPASGARWSIPLLEGADREPGTGGFRDGAPALLPLPDGRVLLAFAGEVWHEGGIASSGDGLLACPLDAAGRCESATRVPLASAATQWVGAVGPAGTLALAGGSPSGAWVARSLDAGATWNVSALDASIVPAPARALRVTLDGAGNVHATFADAGDDGLGRFWRASVSTRGATAEDLVAKARSLGAAAERTRGAAVVVPRGAGAATFWATRSAAWREAADVGIDELRAASASWKGPTLAPWDAAALPDGAIAILAESDGGRLALARAFDPSPTNATLVVGRGAVRGPDGDPLPRELDGAAIADVELAANGSAKTMLRASNAGRVTLRDLAVRVDAPDGVEADAEDLRATLAPGAEERWALTFRAGDAWRGGARAVVTIAGDGVSLSRSVYLHTPLRPEVAEGPPPAARPPAAEAPGPTALLALAATAGVALANRRARSLPRERATRRGIADLDRSPL